VSILNKITNPKSINARVGFFLVKKIYDHNTLNTKPITKKVNGKHQDLHFLLKNTNIKDIKMIVYKIGHTIENT